MITWRNKFKQRTMNNFILNILNFSFLTNLFIFQKKEDVFLNYLLENNRVMNIYFLKHKLFEHYMDQILLQEENNSMTKFIFFLY